MDAENLVESYKSGKVSRRRFIATFFVIAPIAAISAYWLWQSKETISLTGTATSTTSTTISSTTTTTSPTATSFTQTTTSSTTVTETTTIPPIEPELKEKFLKIIPNAASFKPVVKDGETIYYEAYDEGGALIGYAFVTEATAPTDKLEIVGFVDLDYKVVAVDIEALSSKLWKKEICEKEFEQQFSGLSVGELALTKDGGKVDGVTGATMSSRAVTEAIKAKVQEIMQK